MTENTSTRPQPSAMKDTTAEEPRTVETVAAVDTVAEEPRSGVSKPRPSDLVNDILPVEGEDLSADQALSKPEEEQLLEALKDVVDPELGINVVDLGLVYGVHVDDDSAVTVDMTLTSAACPLTDVIEAQTDTALDGLATRSTINWVWMPPWTPEKISDDGREQLRALGFNV